MSEPIYEISTERLYSRLPETYRHLDEQNDWQFKKYISSIGDQLDEVDVLISRLLFIPEEERAEFLASLSDYDLIERPVSTTTYESEFGVADLYSTSDLVDARTADDAWIPWLGSILGVRFAGTETVLQQRTNVVHPSFKKGTRLSLYTAIKNLLTGTQYLRFYAHSDGAGGSINSPATEWDLLLVTLPSETPISSGDLLAAITASGAKPAGVVLHHVSYNVIWDTIDSDLPTWADIEALGSWGALEIYQP